MYVITDETMVAVLSKTRRSLRHRRANPARFVDAGTVLRVGLGLVRHARHLRPLWSAPRSSALGRLLAERPEIWGVVYSPYLAASWTPRQRIERIVDHCRTVEAIGPLLDMPLDAYTRLLTLGEFDPGLTVVLDQQRWLLREGQMTFSLRENGDQLFALSFCLSSEAGRLTAYIGGIQGRREAGVLDRYRRLTKLAHGARPSDLTVDLFRMFCGALGVERVFAVSDANRHQRSRYFARRAFDPNEAVFMSYDDLWSGRGGQLRGDGFYELPSALRRRPLEDVAANKRSLYKRRYAALDAIEARMRAMVRAGLRPEMRGIYQPAEH
jgi:uncharacterized protein